MHEDFWRERWQRNEIGFHQAQVNPYLQRHWPALALPPGTQVLVPLCGKSLDLAWLAGQSYRVLGVELAESAVQAFFAEQGITPEIDQYGVFRRYRAGAIELLCGDFFALQASEVRECHGLYDRAALIALPEVLRERYVAHLAAVLPSRCVGLLVTMDYPQEQMPGPPFAVSDAWVREWLEPAWVMQIWEELDVLQENPRFLQRGLTRMQERAYQLRRR